MKCMIGSYPHQELTLTLPHPQPLNLISTGIRIQMQPRVRAVARKLQRDTIKQRFFFFPLMNYFGTKRLFLLFR